MEVKDVLEKIKIQIQADGDLGDYEENALAFFDEFFSGVELSSNPTKEMEKHTLTLAELSYLISPGAPIHSSADYMIWALEKAFLGVAIDKFTQPALFKVIEDGVVHLNQKYEGIFEKATSFYIDRGYSYKDDLELVEEEVNVHQVYGESIEYKKNLDGRAGVLREVSIQLGKAFMDGWFIFESFTKDGLPNYMLVKSTHPSKHEGQESVIQFPLAIGARIFADEVEVYSGDKVIRFNR